MAEYISVADTAKLVRKALKANFPGIKFSVRSSSYAGGASIRVAWTDGPSEIAVDSIVKVYQGSTFDSSIDLRSYVTGELDGKEVHFGADYVNCDRDLTRVFVETVTRQFCDRWGIPMLSIRGTEESAYVNSDRLDYHMQRALWKLMKETDAKDMNRVYEAEDEREAKERAEWEAGAAERERQAKAEQEKQEREEKARREREAKAQQERRQREREEAQRRQQQQERDAFKAAQRMVLSSKYSALIHLGLSMHANKDDVLKAFRNKVKEMADGQGGYTGDMDFLVKVKERALQ